MVKTLKKSSPEPAGRFPLNLVCIQPTIVYSNDDPRMTLTYFTARSFSYFGFLWGKSENWIFQKLLQPVA